MFPNRGERLPERCYVQSAAWLVRYTAFVLAVHDYDGFVPLSAYCLLIVNLLNTDYLIYLCLYSLITFSPTLLACFFVFPLYVPISCFYLFL